MVTKYKKIVLPWVNQDEHINPTAIVLHWWGVSSWIGNLDFFIKRLQQRKLSVQFVVLKNGQVIQLVEDPTVYCYHARCANKSSIGIEIQARGKRDLDKNDKQFLSVVNLIRHLVNKYNLQKNFEVKHQPALTFYGISSHKEVDKYCSHNRYIKKRDVHNDYVRRVLQLL